MYFDFLYYRKVVAYAWAQKQWPGRNRILFQLLFLAPLTTAAHALFFLLDYVFYPALWSQRVEKPIFIIGHARSGTTMMQRLMARDADRFSFFLYWETFFPALTERAIIRGFGWLDQRILSGSLRKRVEAWDEKTFGPWRHIHEQGLWIPEEDLFVMRAAFMPQQWTLEMPLTDQLDIFHIDELSERRRARWLHHYRECVKRQLVQTGDKRTHLSKNPVMSGWVNALLYEFPDARFVVMVRDPISCIPSTLKLVEGSWQAKKWQTADYLSAQKALTQICFDCFQLPSEALSVRLDVPQYFVDYRELVSEPLVTLEKVYEALDLSMSETVRQELTQRESKEKQHSSRFRYSLDDYAITAEDIESELAVFYDRYGWPRPSEQTANAVAAQETAH